MRATIELPNPLYPVVEWMKQLHWWALRAMGRPRVYVWCTGAMPDNGSWDSRKGGLSVPSRFASSLTAWECPHAHLSRQKGRKGEHATNELAFACARREARRRGWQVVELTKDGGWRRPTDNESDGGA